MVRVEGIEPSSPVWKTGIMDRYTTPAGKAAFTRQHILSGIDALRTLGTFRTVRLRCSSSDQTALSCESLC